MSPVSQQIQHRQRGADTMQSIDITRIIDEQKIRRFNVQLIVVSFLLCLVDGYDFAAISYAAPGILKAWAISNPAALAPVFSASLVGILIGSPLFGLVGDYFGRKKITVVSCLICGGFTWASVYGNTLEQLLLLRFLSGLGMGGLLPNTIALNAEYAPRRIRALLVVIMFTGTPLGAAVPGAISAWLMPTYGWTILFSIGGAVSLAIAVISAVWLPESVKYLALKPGRRAETLALVQTLQPGLVVEPDARFTISDEKQYSGISPKYLFMDGMALATPLLWLLFILNMMGYFFILSWTPTLLASARVSIAYAAIATSMFQLGGIVGSLCMARPMDKMGMLPLVILFAVTGPIVGCIGFVGGYSIPVLLGIMFCAGFGVLGLQISLNVTAALIYPTSLRANGSGWAQGIGRVGSIMGPLIGGILIASHVPVEQLYLWSTLPFVIGAIACFALMRLLEDRDSKARPIALATTAPIEGAGAT
jgi:MFS transporter, AAHS family, 4-hydroxybenzoate transporter